VRQPSRNVFRWGACDVRPSRCRVIGTSVIFSPRKLALMIISVANSMPVQRWSSRSYMALIKTAQTAVNVVDRRAEPFPCEKGKNWIANPTLQEWHRTRLNRTTTRRKPTSLDQVKSFSQFFYNLRELEKIVAVVRVRYDDESVCSQKACRAF
jgi:hypothetical protein